MESKSKIQSQLSSSKKRKSNSNVACLSKARDYKKNNEARERIYRAADNLNW
ncbi:hypothetical protein [Aliikangiella coralliicola]|uniref:hypothetical protein n=1 Tax=Aliikangiella coralliicola TaxID=2592383 RepID=UPI00143D38BE|nr:hypothetical protein [Aliikangiella coralliicola]